MRTVNNDNRKGQVRLGERAICFRLQLIKVTSAALLSLFYRLQLTTSQFEKHRR